MDEQAKTYFPHVIAARPSLGEAAYEVFHAAYTELKDKNPERPVNIVFPTGSTPKGLYKHIRSRHDPKHDNGLNVRVFALDEYVVDGRVIPDTDPRSYAREIRKEITAPLKIDESLHHFFNTQASTADVAAEEMERAIAHNGGLDLVILGIGQNGHIGFNEPGSAFNSRARLVDTSPKTHEANAEHCKDHGGVPGQAVTLGIATILEAKKILLLADANKLQIMERAFTHEISPDMPTSALRTHNDCTVVCAPDIAWRIGG